MGGDDNDSIMFAKLQEVVEEYNVSNLSNGGKAKLQMYERCEAVDSLSDVEETPPQKREKLKLLNR